MGMQVIGNAMLQCAMGAAPGTMMVLPVNCVMAGGQPAANIMDNKPMVNIMPFAVCQSIANPTVASATAAAMGALTPMPCIPVTTAPWIVGAPTVMVGGMPALNDSSMLMCNWAGVIQVSMAGQFTVMIP